MGLGGGDESGRRRGGVHRSRDSQRVRIADSRVNLGLNSDMVNSVHSGSTSGGRDPSAADTVLGDYFSGPEGVLVMGRQESTVARHAGPVSARYSKMDSLTSLVSGAGHGHVYVMSDDAHAAATEAAGEPVGDDKDASVRVSLDNYSDFGRNVAQHSIYAGVPSDTSEERINGDVQTCQELKDTVELGRNVSVYLHNNVTCFESVTVVSGQYVWVRGLPLDTEGRDKITVSVGSPFSFDGNASTSSTDDLAEDGSSSLFVINSGGWLGLRSLEFRPGVGEEEGEEGEMNVVSSTSGGSTDVASSDSAGTEGGGVRAVYNAGELWVISCSFSALSSNSSNGVVPSGGAIYSDNAGSVRIETSDFYSNKVSGSGGAIHATGTKDSPISIHQCQFSRNSAGTGLGGAISAGGEATLVIEESTFDSNSAPDGAAVSCCRCEVTAGMFTNHITTGGEEGNGALVSSEEGTSTCAARSLAVNSSTFVSNEGGGLAVLGGDLSIVSSTFSNNTRGAAVCITTTGAEDESEDVGAYQIQILDSSFEGTLLSVDNDTDEEEDGEADGGSDGYFMIIKDSAEVDEGARPTAYLDGVSCPESDDASMCQVIFQEGNFQVDSWAVSCQVCNVAGEPVDVQTDVKTTDDSLVSRDALLVWGLAVGFALCGLAVALRVIRPRRRRADKKNRKTALPTAVALPPRQRSEKFQHSKERGVATAAEVVSGGDAGMKKRGEEERRERGGNLERAEDGAMGSRGSHVKAVGDVDDKMVALRAPFRVAVSLIGGDSLPPPASTVVVTPPSESGSGGPNQHKPSVPRVQGMGESVGNAKIQPFSTDLATDVAGTRSQHLEYKPDNRRAGGERDQPEGICRYPDGDTKMGRQEEKKSDNKDDCYEFSSDDDDWMLSSSSCPSSCSSPGGSSSASSSHGGSTYTRPVSGRSLKTDGRDREHHQTVAEPAAGAKETTGVGAETDDDVGAPGNAIAVRASAPTSASSLQVALTAAAADGALAAGAAIKRGNGDIGGDRVDEASRVQGEACEATSVEGQLSMRSNTSGEDDSERIHQLKQLHKQRIQQDRRARNRLKMHRSPSSFCSLTSNSSKSSVSSYCSSVSSSSLSSTSQSDDENTISTSASGRSLERSRSSSRASSRVSSRAASIRIVRSNLTSTASIGADGLDDDRSSLFSDSAYESDKSTGNEGRCQPLPSSSSSAARFSAFLSSVLGTMPSQEIPPLMEIPVDCRAKEKRRDYTDARQGWGSNAHEEQGQEGQQERQKHQQLGLGELLEKLVSDGRVEFSPAVSPSTLDGRQRPPRGAAAGAHGGFFEFSPMSILGSLPELVSAHKDGGEGSRGGGGGGVGENGKSAFSAGASASSGAGVPTFISGVWKRSGSRRPAPVQPGFSDDESDNVESRHSSMAEGCM